MSISKEKGLGLALPKYSATLTRTGRQIRRLKLRLPSPARFEGLQKMASRGRSLLLTVTLLVLSLGVLARGACFTRISPLPTVMHGSHVYMLDVSSADAICR
ncbi:hypothetical protein ACKKBF_B05210 [Auxenochlorella protothecoides x Auxenochlorella symbiontica]